MESVVSVNVTNFITVGLMALIFILVTRFILAQTKMKLPGNVAV